MRMKQEPNAASVALLHKGKVLLIQRAKAPYQHLWTLPGGRREAGETAEECAAREVREEVGLRCYALRPIVTRQLESASGGWTLAVFATEAMEGEIVTSDEIADHRWVTPAQASGMRTTARLMDVLERAFRLFDRT